MHQLRQPVRQEWRRFLDAITQGEEGQPVTVEIVSAELGSRVEADRLPLSYVSYDDRDDVVVVAVRGGDASEDRLDHIVENPWKILFDPPSPDAVRRIDIEGPDGAHTLVTLHDREAAEAAQ